MNSTILTDNKEIETLDLPSWWSDDFPCVATLIKTGVKGHRQLFAADVDVLPGVGFAFYQATWLNDHDADRREHDDDHPVQQHRKHRTDGSSGCEGR